MKSSNLNKGEVASNLNVLIVKI